MTKYFGWFGNELKTRFKIIAFLLLLNIAANIGSYGYARRQTLRVCVIHDGKKEEFVIHDDPSWYLMDGEKPHRQKRDANPFRLNGSPGHLVGCVRNKDILGDENEGQVALMVKLGHRATLPCYKCGDTKASALAAKLWFRFDRQVDVDIGGIWWQPVELELDTHDDERLNRVFVTAKHALIIEDFQPDDVGTYFCEAYSSESESYSEKFAFKSTDTGSGTAAMALAWKQLVGENKTDFLFHVDVEIPKVEVLVTADGNGYPKPQPAHTDVESNVKIFTAWGSWSACTACGQQAERRRAGECTVALLDPAKKSTPPHIDHILRIYQGGAPCHSSLFSPRDFDVIVERPPEVEVEGCFSPCKDDTKKHRNLADSFAGENIDIETAKPTTGVPSITIKKRFGEEIKLLCPGAQDDTAVRWQNGSRLLRGKELAQTTGGRVEINAFNMLIIRKSLTTDTNTYTCYHDLQKRGSFKVQVEAEPVERLDIRQYLIYLAASYVVDFILFVGCMWSQHKQRLVQVRLATTRKRSSNKHLLSDSDSDSE